MANFQSAVIAILSVTVVLGVMIFVHEWGHFIAAKLSGVKVEVFSFGFGTRLFGVKRGDTDYRLSALPFGGYVRMAGDNPIEERTGAAYEFLSKPRWVRVVIACAGPAMNIIFGFLIFWGIFWLVGIPSEDYLRQPAQVAAVSQAAGPASGVQSGDRIVDVNGVATPTWESVFNQLKDEQPNAAFTFTVEHNNTQQKLTAKMPVPPATVDSVLGYPLMPPVADEIAIGSPAEHAGMKEGDVIVAIDGKPIVTWLQLVDGVVHSDGRPIQFTVRRDGHDVSFDIAPMRTMGADGNMVWQIGVSRKVQEKFERQTLATAGNVATVQTGAAIKQIGMVLGGLFTGKVKIRQLTSVVGIARESGRAAKRGPVDLIWLMAIISLNLGLLNLLPIPILDGGHVLMLAIEGVLRRDLSLAVKERFVQVGLVFLLGIFAFVMYSDIFKLVQSH
ncbi:MAG: RIP metalloprotease RseP [Candidatus Acidiferrales bacterium]